MLNDINFVIKKLRILNLLIYNHIFFLILDLFELLTQTFFHIYLVSLIGLSLIQNLLVVELTHLPLRAVKLIEEPKVISIQFTLLIRCEVAAINKVNRIAVMSYLKPLNLIWRLWNQIRNLRYSHMRPSFNFNIWHQRLPCCFFLELQLSFLFDLLDQNLSVPLLVVLVLGVLLRVLRVDSCGQVVGLQSIKLVWLIIKCRLISILINLRENIFHLHLMEMVFVFVLVPPQVPIKLLHHVI